MTACLVLACLLADPVPRMPSCVEWKLKSVETRQPVKYRDCITRFSDGTFIRISGM